MSQRIWAAIPLTLGLTLTGPAAAREGAKKAEDLFTIVGETKGFEPYKIAVTEPESNDRNLARFVRRITVNNLRIATAFKVLKTRTYPKGWRQKNLQPTRRHWRAIGAQGLIMAKLVVTGAQTKYQFALWAFARGSQPVLQKTYASTRKAARSVVHQWCNAVMKHYTKVKGAFGTQIAFVASHGARQKYVYVMDHDGHNLRRISKPKSINILPAWSPNGRNIIFTSYVRRNPDLYMVPSTGGVLPKRVSKRVGLNSGAVFSPDGTKVALTLTKDRNSEIYVLDTKHRGLRGWRVLKRLTRHSGIDTSPTWSPDGRRIAFVSARYGYPQLWVMNADGSRKRRLTRRGYYNQTPAWCPRKGSNLIAFTSRKGRRFSIFTYNIATKAYRRITYYRHKNNEEPTWAPNCQLIAFASSRGGIWVSNRDGTAQTQIYKSRALQPRWGPWATMH